MRRQIIKTGERILPERIESEEEYAIYLRHLFAYEFAKDLVPKDGYILEVGCGEGYGVSLLSQKVRKIVGLDVDKKTVSCALSKYETRNASFQLYAGKDIPYEDATFDGVVSFQVVEHIKNDVNYIAEIFRVLKKGGIFIVSTPNKSCRLRPNQKPWNRFHIREYNPFELESLLRTKFSDVKIFGLKGNEEINKAELKRIKRNLRIISFDPLNIRRLIPISIEARILRVMRRIVKGRNKTKIGFGMKYSINDFSLAAEDVEHGLDLIGVGRK